MVKTPVADVALEHKQFARFTTLVEGNMLKRNLSESAEALGSFLMGFA